MDDPTPRRSAPRVPSPWWVLVPGVLLVLVGVRAVTTEVARAREDSRERARVAAEQVVRAFHTLLDEYMGAAPRMGSEPTLAEAREKTRHLYPTWIVTTGGRWIDGTRFRRREGWEVTPTPPSERDLALASDVIGRLSGDAQPELAESSLLAGAAAAVESEAVAGLLLVRAAHFELRRGGPRAAEELVDRVLDLPPTAADERLAPLGADRPWLAAAELGAEVLELTRPRGAFAEAHWIWDAVDTVAADPWGLPAARREAILARYRDVLSDPEDQARFREMTQTYGLIHAECATRGIGRGSERIFAGGVGSDFPFATFDLGVQARTRMSVADADADAADDGTGRVWIGGAIPEATLKSRVIDEIDAASQRFDARIVIRTNEDDPVLGDVEAHFSGGLVEEVPCAYYWRVEARVDEPSGLPTSAWLLGGALAAASAMLGLGAFALSRAAAHHARLAEERRNFLDHVAHEVRTPAAAMLALSEELERGHVETERQATYHEHLLRESRRLADLVEETLDLTRLESGRLVSKREGADLRDVVRAAIEAARVEPEQVKVALPGEPVPVNVDVAAVRRAVRNLVDNALKHGACDEPADVRLAVTNDLANLTVRDHGKGIPADHVERVFERFHRVPSATHEVKGVGLGLALVREVAEAHDGKVSATNADGGGARFTFTLPLEDRA